MLSNGHLVRISIDCRRGAEDHVSDVMFLHGLQQLESSLHIAPVVEHGLLDRFPDGFQACKVDHTFNLILVEHCLQSITVEQIDLLKRARLSRLRPHSSDRLSRTVTQVVHDDDIVARLLTSQQRVASTVTGCSVTKMLIYRISSGVGRWIGSVHVNDWLTSVIDSQNRVHTGFRQKRSYHYHCSCRHFQYHLELPDHHLAEVIYSADDLCEFVWRSDLR